MAEVLNRLLSVLAVELRNLVMRLLLAAVGLVAAWLLVMHVVLPSVDRSFQQAVQRLPTPTPAVTATPR